ncbi:ABC transporter permease subunit [Phytoactinopolyspora alkaliphila]|uniref:ABC transporter permease subunit n=1 Tax=Phytoactinopolyspora alkaliphila TaxID=1783498 RepID=A0A6N9YTU3_9ACTN|nr:ABC transporter permease subunit [Phytoactinopolyspora alkaliphila]NED98402.1 ABC transporter permease subunit [Phytoactinopolyspora alkaliphila]
MKGGIILVQMLRERRRGFLWWSLGIAALAVITAASYPAVKDAGRGFDEFMESLPEGVVQMMGAADGITTPAGYLNSQFYANVFPIVLLIFGIAAGTWSIAGAEREGTLEPLLANPVPRWRVAVERLAGVTLLLAMLTLIASALLVMLRDPFELSELSVGNLAAAGVGVFLLALLFACLAFAVGAATGSKGLAIATGAGLATATYVVFGLSSLVEFFENLRWSSPWYWFLSPSPLTEGWTFQAIGAPLLVLVPVAVIGIAIFHRRDLT